MSEDVRENHRAQRRHSLERYRPGGANRQHHRGEESREENVCSMLGGLSLKDNERNPHLAPNDLRNKLNKNRYRPENPEQHREERQGHYRGRPSRSRRKNNHYNNNGENDRNGGVQGPLPLVKRNTECFDPSYEAPDLRILSARPGGIKYEKKMSTRDVVSVSDLFGSSDDMTLYDSLLKEIKDSGVDPEKLWQSWHGDSHVIADDKQPWKEKCPTFAMVIDKIANYFDMEVKATRFNWYRDASEWKPYHHDAAAVKPKIAKLQNFTAAVSFGAERDAAFQHAKTKTVVSLPQPNGSVYTFGRDANIIWRHGIPQLPPGKNIGGGRISIILWGWADQFEL